MKNRVERAALEVLLKHNIQSLPVVPLDICKQAGIKVYKNSDANLLTGTQIGLSFYDRGSFRVIIDYNQILTRRRFTLAHELGHILLGHLLVDTPQGRTFDKSKPEMETQADIFASRLLAPACVLWGLNLHTPQEIATFCNISMSSARIVAYELKKRYEKENPFQNDIEIKVFENFKKWIDMANTVFGKTYDFAKYEKAFKQVYSY